MSNLNLPVRSTAEEYRALLAGKESKRIAYATTLVGLSAGVRIWHHESIIAYLADTGEITINAGGYTTATTANRLHQILRAVNPRLGLNRERGTLYLHIDVSSPPYECGGITYQLDRYPSHRLELNPGAPYKITTTTSGITVDTPPDRARYYDAGHPTYYFETH